MGINVTLGVDGEGVIAPGQEFHLQFRLQLVEVEGPPPIRIGNGPTHYKCLCCMRSKTQYKNKNKHYFAVNVIIIPTVKFFFA
jgi:hypothetical protein